MSHIEQAETITIKLDTALLAEIENYNTYRRGAASALHDLAQDPNNTKLRRADTKAGKSYSAASMSLGWHFARILRDAGIAID